MALVKCRECEKEVSSNADRCPHCGISHPSWDKFSAREEGKQFFAGGVAWLVKAALGLAAGVFIAHLFVSGKAMDFISAVRSSCQVINVTAQHDVFFVNGEPDAGVKVTALVRKLGRDGKVTITAELSSNEGKWTRSVAGDFKRNQERNAVVQFTEPSMNATNLRYTAKCSS